jgi:hypothetical protein
VTQGGTRPLAGGEESLFYLSVGPVAAFLLGVALIPLRGVTTASNFTLAFMALTVAVAEFGGRAAAVATALSSALSLDFFLTQPYLRLTIAGKHDIIAFLGLAACGLIAAAFGAKRGQRIADLAAARGQLELLHTTAVQLERGTADEAALTRLLDASRAALPLAAAALRDGRGYVLAAAGNALERPLPDPVIELDTLLPPGAPPPVMGRRHLPLPPQGARLALTAGDSQVGWLDVWGDGTPATLPARHALSDVARLLAALLDARQ